MTAFLLDLQRRRKDAVEPLEELLFGFARLSGRTDNPTFLYSIAYFESVPEAVVVEAMPAFEVGFEYGTVRQPISTLELPDENPSHLDSGASAERAVAGCLPVQRHGNLFAGKFPAGPSGVTEQPVLRVFELSHGDSNIPLRVLGERSQENVQVPSG